MPLSFAYLRVELSQLLLMFRGRSFDVRLLISEVVDQPALRHVVVEGEQPVEVALLERVVFMIMAARASQRHAHPDCRCRLDAICHILDAKLFLYNAALGAGPVITLES